MAHPQIGRALRLMNMEKNGTPTVAEFEALLADQGRVDACIELLQRSGALGQIIGYPNLMQALEGTDEWLTLALSSAIAMAAAAKNQATMLTFIASQSALDAIFARQDVADVFMSGTGLAKAEVPKMTSNTTPSGVASASTIYSGTYAPWAAFSQNAGTPWVSSDAAGGKNEWLQYSFSGEAFIFGVTMLPSDGQFRPINCRIECSNDGAAFNTVKSFTTINNAIHKIGVKKSGFYKHWRLFVESTNNINRCGIESLNFTGFVKP